MTSENIYDKDNSSSYNVSVGVDNSKNETQTKMELGLSDSQKKANKLYNNRKWKYRSKDKQIFQMEI